MLLFLQNKSSSIITSDWISHDPHFEYSSNVKGLLVSIKNSQVVDWELSAGSWSRKRIFQISQVLQKKKLHLLQKKTF